MAPIPPKPTTVPVGVTAASPDQKTVVAFHKYDDVDVSSQSHHHTIGNERGKAADGAHDHHGGSGKLIFDPSVDIISGTRGTLAGIGSIVDQIATILEQIGASNATTP
jgi:hypothetical protein